MGPSLYAHPLPELVPQIWIGRTALRFADVWVADALQVPEEKPRCSQNLSACRPFVATAVAAVEVSPKPTRRLIVQIRDGNASAARRSSETLRCANMVGTGYLRVTALKERRSEMLNELTCRATVDHPDPIDRSKVL